MRGLSLMNKKEHDNADNAAMLRYLLFFAALSVDNNFCYCCSSAALSVSLLMSCFN